MKSCLLVLRFFVRNTEFHLIWMYLLLRLTSVRFSFLSSAFLLQYFRVSLREAAVSVRESLRYLSQIQSVPMQQVYPYWIEVWTSPTLKFSLCE